MMGLQFLGPIFASVLYVIIFQKAGFRGPILIVCAAPVAGTLFVGGFLWGIVAFDDAVMTIVLLISLVLSLAPLLVLAFKAWPPLSVAAIQTEK